MCKRKRGRGIKKRRRNKYVYLGKRVRDISKRGLDSPSEFRGIKNAIIRDVKSGRIDKKTARGRLLLLYQLTKPEKNSKVKNLSPRTRERLRKEIRAAMRRI